MLVLNAKLASRKDEATAETRNTPPLAECNVASGSPKIEITSTIFAKYMRITFFISVISILIGRAYQNIFWDAPLRALIWDEAIMTRPILWLTGQDWQTFASNQATNTYIRWYSIFVGLILLSTAFLAWRIECGNRKKWPWIFFIFSCSILLFHSFLDMKDKFYHVAQVLEPTIQIFIPIVYIMWKYEKLKKIISLKMILKILVAITFAAHGLYAMGFYPVPGNFIDMTIISTGFTEDQTRIFLEIIGWLDLSLLIFLFIPQTEKFAIWYAILWGLLTAVARIWTGFDIDALWSSLHGHLYKMIFRLAHGLIPLTILYIISKEKKQIQLQNVK